MRKEALPEGSPVMQNVRVGDRLGQRYTGVGSAFNLGEELVKSKTLGFPTFEAVYLRFTYNNGTKYLSRFTPDEKVLVMWDDGHDRNGNEYPLSEVFVEDSSEIKLKIEEDQGDAEMVVIPNFAFQTPELLATLPDSGIKQDFVDQELRINDLSL